MNSNFAQALALVLQSEGGKSDDPQDPGGRTNFGITQAVYSAWLASHGSAGRDVYTITPDEVAAIYKANYWDKIRGDLLSSGLDYATFDFAVNSGVARAAISLQDIVGAAPDGQIGALTLADLSRESPNFLITKLCAMRLGFLGRLSTWAHFGTGWTNRVHAVEAAALKMALT